MRSAIRQYFKVNVNPVADDATVKVGQPVGYEDAGREGGNTKDKSGAITNPTKGIVLPITVTSTDKDGSETFTVTIKDIPNGSGLYAYDNSTKTYKLVEVSKDGKTITIDGVVIANNTSGTELNDGTAGNKADLDGSEKRTYTISGIPEGTVVTLGGQTTVANKDGIATIEFDNTNNKDADPDFSMKFPENYSGTVEGKITLAIS